MLNKDNQRELAYFARVTGVFPMDADKLERVMINGWACVCSKGEFKQGDLGVFFETDSKLPEVPPFSQIEFLKSKHFKIKAQKIRGVISQGLFLPLSAFGWEEDNSGQFAGDESIIVLKRNEKGVIEEYLTEKDFLTEKLDITYYIKEDNNRKGSSINPQEKYKRMAQRHKELFSKQPFRWIMKRDWGKQLLFIFFGKKRDNPKGFPTHFEYIHKTDEERVENMPWILEDKSEWIKTTKLDGTSATYILERKLFGRFEFYVTSRNIRQLTPEQLTYHNQVQGSTGNEYWDMAYKYNIEEFLKNFLKARPKMKYVCLQGEIVGPNIQGNPHKLKEVEFYGFNFIDSKHGRWNSLEAANYCGKRGINWVPIIDPCYILPDDFEEFKLSADGPCELKGASGPREGYVYRNYEDPTKSFKNVSREYILKHS